MFETNMNIASTIFVILVRVHTSLLNSIVINYNQCTTTTSARQKFGTKHELLWNSSIRFETLALAQWKGKTKNNKDKFVYAKLYVGCAMHLTRFTFHFLCTIHIITILSLVSRVKICLKTWSCCIKSISYKKLYPCKIKHLLRGGWGIK